MVNQSQRETVVAKKDWLSSDSSSFVVLADLPEALGQLEKLNITDGCLGKILNNGRREKILFALSSFTPTLNMDIRRYVESQYAAQVQFFEQSAVFQQLESGAAIAFYDQFIAQLCQTHLKSPQILAFLYAVAPPAAAPHIQHNMLEELGLDEEGICHPELLHQLAAAAGFDETARTELIGGAQEQLRVLCTDPLMFGTMKELGLSVLLEVTCFEWMLSRLAGRIGRALQTHRHLPAESLAWFFHHSEVDIRHAEEGLTSVVQYVEYYEIDPADLEAIVDITFRENIFVKRYFGAIALATETHMLEPLS